MHSPVRKGRENALSDVIEMSLKGRSETAKQRIGKEQEQLQDEDEEKVRAICSCEIISFGAFCLNYVSSLSSRSTLLPADPPVSE